MNIFRGDSFKFDFNSTLDDGTAYVFQKGDTLKVAIKDRLSSSIYVLFKEINIEEATEEIRIAFTNEEMADITEGDKILEIELTDNQGNVSTLYQEKIKVKGDVINERTRRYNNN